MLNTLSLSPRVRERPGSLTVEPWHVNYNIYNYNNSLKYHSRQRPMCLCAYVCICVGVCARMCVCLYAGWHKPKKCSLLRNPKGSGSPSPQLSPRFSSRKCAWIKRGNCAKTQRPAAANVSYGVCLFSCVCVSKFQRLANHWNGFVMREREKGLNKANIHAEMR